MALRVTKDGVLLLHDATTDADKIHLRANVIAASAASRLERHAGSDVIIHRHPASA